ncbi:hypothetical protein LJ655_02440 [Paraburkholderia sp. MMS20-SJTN17]|uniref:Extensin n=1 Tax=Paraburkholderia translucens TaxID=2886945 RepID=A0ABS8K7R4_9BURK|nr:hypothetical protein [Paraburkholderia sp. MMS20-SJTN17]MCC8400764.1 hypothetical protein [Paraburkholderia sp. MMS20-SJTN17]
MTNTGKLLIVGLLVVDAGVAGYLLYPRDDQLPAVTGTVTRGATGAADQQPQTDTTRAAGGRMMPAEPASPAPPHMGIANNVVIAPQAALPRTDSAAPAPAAPPLANPAEVAHARSKPQPYAQQSAQARPQSGPRVDQTQARRRENTQPNGANSVAAMLTNELVRESAKPDPSLPMPSGFTVPMPAGTDAGNGAATGRGSNPVASAMTDQLVRESSKLTPTRPASEPPPLNKP